MNEVCAIAHAHKLFPPCVFCSVSLPTPTHLGEHNYIKPRSFGTLIDLLYADDICWVGGNCNHGVELFKKNIPEYLALRNLTKNPTETEEYEIHKAKFVWVVQKKN